MRVQTRQSSGQWGQQSAFRLLTVLKVLDRLRSTDKGKRGIYFSLESHSLTDQSVSET